MTAVKCPHCTLTCAGPQGLASHIRSMHPDIWRARADGATSPGEAPPAASPSPPPASHGLVWEDPPKLGRHATAIPEVLALLGQLRDRPGEWARLRIYEAATSASALAGKLRKRADCEDIEFRTAKHGSKGSALYGRAKVADR